MLIANNALSTGNKQTIKNLRYSHFRLCLILTQPPWKIYLENAFWNDCNNKKNVNIKELFLLIKAYFIHNII